MRFILGLIFNQIHLQLSHPDKVNPDIPDFYKMLRLRLHCQYLLTHKQIDNPDDFPKTPLYKSIMKSSH